VPLLSTALLVLNWCLPSAEQVPGERRSALLPLCEGAGVVQVRLGRVRGGLMGVHMLLAGVRVSLAFVSERLLCVTWGRRRAAGGGLRGSLLRAFFHIEV
jgi:hypothetical protein